MPSVSLLKPCKTKKNARFNRAFFEAYLDRANHRLGDAFVEAKQKLRPKNPQQVDFQDFTLLGDPTLLLTRREMNQ